MDSRFKALTGDVSAYANLAKEVVARSQGISLWVALVIRSLLEGATYADSLDDMYRRLEAFPKDLGTYFQRMIDDIPEVYRLRTALTLRIALAADVPLPLSTYHFIDELFSDPDFALRIKRRVVTGMEFPFIVGTESLTLATVPESFDPYSILCHAFLAETKWTRGDLTRPVEDFANYAACVREEDIEKNRIDLAIYNIEAEFDSFVTNNTSSSKSFYNIALLKGLRWYIKQEKIDSAAKGGDLREDFMLAEAILLLNDAEVVDSGRLPHIIRPLVERGAANNIVNVKVVGKDFMEVWLPRANKSPEIRGQVRDILKIFIEYGLDPALHVPRLGHDEPDMTLKDYIKGHVSDREPTGFASSSISTRAPWKSLDCSQF
ncbi:hypothetical protein F5Y10DRAFT_272184 [Nemania abortiva]|nr:hypothetical protein F5Y10DRAFT_272184 [Nemania abortiva]